MELRGNGLKHGEMLVNLLSHVSDKRYYFNTIFLLNWKNWAIMAKILNQRTEGPESRTDGETLIFWDW